MFLDASRGGHVPDGATAALLGNPLLVALFVLAAPRGESVAEDDAAGRAEAGPWRSPEGLGGACLHPRGKSESLKDFAQGDGLMPQQTGVQRRHREAAATAEHQKWLMFIDDFKGHISDPRGSAPRPLPLARDGGFAFL